MNIGLANLIDEGSVAHVEESRTFYAAKQAAGGRQGPTNHEEVKEAAAAWLPDPVTRAPLCALPVPATARSR